MGGEIDAGFEGVLWPVMVPWLAAKWCACCFADYLDERSERAERAKRAKEREP
jgi:hypothetical protein